MKKIINISMLAVTLAATSAFGQGWLAIGTGKSQVWDGFTTAGVSVRSSNVDVGLFWAAANTANPMTALTGLANTPTTGSSTTTESYTAAQAWTDILGSGWTFGQSAQISGGVVTASSTSGVVLFNGGATFSLTGTSSGTSYALMLVSWNSLYANPTAAQTAGSAIGWTYLTASSGSLGTSSTDNLSPNISANGPNFGTFIPLAPTPEPGTLALAALGGAAMLFIRRKK